MPGTTANVKDRFGVKTRLYRANGGRCAFCLKEAPFHKMTLDHKVPKSRGGSDEESNLTVACRSCNASKGNRTLEVIEGW